MRQDVALEQGEERLGEAKISKAALVLLWVSVPAFLLVFGGIVYLPQIAALWLDAELRQAAAEALGVDTLSFAQLLAAAGEGTFFAAFADLAAVVRGIAVFFLALLLVAWFVWACVYTRQNMRYSLTLTDRRVIATAKGERLEAEYQEIYNVAVLRSVWGRLFGFGEISVQTEKGSVAVKNVSGAERWRRELLARSDEARARV